VLRPETDDDGRAERGIGDAPSRGPSIPTPRAPKRQRDERLELREWARRPREGGSPRSRVSCAERGTRARLARFLESQRHALPPRRAARISPRDLA